MTCNTLTHATLAAIYARLPQLKAWIRDIEEHCYSEAIQGRTIPGYKLVEGRSVRRWIDETAAGSAMIAAGHSASDVHKRKIISIGEAEKLLGKGAELLATLTVKAPGAPALVPDSDPRSTFTGNSAGEEFQ